VKALVTGATGMVGANLVRELLREQWEVRVLVRPNSDTRALRNLHIDTSIGDVFDPESLKQAARDCDVLFHAAAVFSYWTHRPEDLKKIALQGTLNAINAAHNVGVRRVVLTSSSVVLGSDTQPCVRDESSRFNETDAYALAKRAQEKEAFARASQLGLELMAVCPGMCLGPHDYRLSPSNAIICSYLMDPWKVTWPGGCNLVSVRDVAKGHLLVAITGKPGQRYLLGGENLEWSAIHAIIAELCGCEAPKLTANHTSAYLAATAHELLALITRQAPLTTRTQAKMVGRYYWYSHARATELGYRPASGRAALAHGIAWLLSTTHIPIALRASLRPARDVYAAWEEIQTGEQGYVLAAAALPT
jgi:dihydroflavonol-4-reductase